MQDLRRQAKLGLVALTGVALLAGCGNTGANDSVSAALAPPAPAYIPGDPTINHPFALEMTAPLPQELRVMHLVNEVRTIKRLNGKAISGTCLDTLPAVKALSYNGVLAHAARKHADYMSKVGYMAHEEATQGFADTEFNSATEYFWGHKNEDRVQASLRASPLDYNTYDFILSATGENVAAGTSGNDAQGRYISGYANAEETMEAWIRSPSHCRNMMSDNWDYMGVGYAYNGSPQIEQFPRRHMHSWVQSFSSGKPSKPVYEWE